VGEQEKYVKYCQRSWHWSC